MEREVYDEIHIQRLPVDFSSYQGLVVDVAYLHFCTSSRNGYARKIITLEHGRSSAGRNAEEDCESSINNSTHYVIQLCNLRCQRKTTHRASQRTRDRAKGMVSCAPSPMDTLYALVFNLGVHRQTDHARGNHMVTIQLEYIRYLYSFTVTPDILTILRNK